MQITSNGRVRRTKTEWREIVKRFEESGLTEKEFCQREDIHSAGLTRWRRKLMTSPAASSAFVPMTPAQGSSWSLRVTLPNGIQLRFES